MTFIRHFAITSGGELFPAQLPEGLSGVTFLQFFQTDRTTGEAKGIVRLDLETLT